MTFAAKLWPLTLLVHSVGRRLESSSTPPPLARGRFFAGIAILAVLTLAAYFNALSVPLLFDDFLALTNNPSIQDARNLGAVLAPPSDAPTAGRPLLNLSFALNYAAHGYAVGGYHAVNLALHLGSALLVFGLVRRVLRTETIPSRLPAGADEIGWLVAALWVLHPVQTASVTYISQRAEVLLGFFYLLTLYAFVRAALEPRQPFWAWLAIGACAGGMASKEVMVTAPIAAWLIDRTFFAGTFRGAVERRAGLYLGLAATWVVLAALMWNTGLGARGVGFGENVTALSYALTQCRVVRDYARLAFWPFPLVFDYGREIYFARAAEALPYVIAMLGALAAVGWALWRGRRAGFFAAVFLLVLAPTSSVVPIRHQPMAENRLYLPLVAASAALVCGLWLWQGRRTRWIAAGIGGAFLALTVARNGVFSSTETLWADTAAKRPQNIRAQNYFAEALRQRGKLAESMRVSRAVLQRAPENDVAHNNLGIILTASPATLAEGVTHLEAAARVRPGYAPVLANLGNALLRLPGRRDEGVARLREAAGKAGNYGEAYASLGTALLVGGNVAEAIEAYANYVRTEPRSAKAHTSLAVALSSAGRYLEAVQHCEIALQLDPNYADAHVNLASVLLQVPGARTEAIAHCRRAIELRPDMLQAWFNLGIALSSLPGAEALAEAKHAFRRVLELRPDMAEARENLDALERRENP